MSNEVQQKNVIFYSVFFILTVVVLNVFIEPENYINFSTFKNGFHKIASSQNIAPQRLFVNVWRITKNSYVDDSLNNQDWMRWRNRYVKHIKTMDDANIAINTMLSSLNDPYTKFLLSDSFSKQKVILDSKITGIGVLFDKTGDEVVINHILDNSPAQSANIMAGDAIVSINGLTTKNQNMESIVKSIEASKNKEIELTLKRNNVLITKKVKRADIPLKTMNYKITKDNIGIITLSNIMGEKAVSDFKDILIKTNDTKGLIIDLRNNYGGILANAIQMANYMLDIDEILSIESRINREYQIYSDGEKVFKNKPIVILINKNTASAAEILAGTLKDNLDVVLIGEASFGKNSIQQVIPLPNDSGLILTTDKYILPESKDIYLNGLTPDILIKQDSIVSEKNDKQMQNAKEMLNRLMENQK